MSLGLTVVVVNFAVIVVLYICGKLIDALAERYDSRTSDN